MGDSGTTAASAAAFVCEGYEINPVVHHCVSVIAEACSSVSLEVHRFDAKGNKKEVFTHKVLDLLAEPNPTQSWADFMQEMVTWYKVTGEIFIQRLPENGPASELWLLNPSYVTVKQGAAAVPTGYEYGTGDNKKVFPVNPVTGKSQILHIKTPNLSNPFRGLSPLAAAARDIDILNAGGKWNSNLLKNSARPSGILKIAGSAGEDTISKLRNYFKNAWQGAKSAGDVPLLTGGAEFVPMSLSPTDMDFQNSLTNSAKNVAMVLGVPLPLVTMEAATFSNMDAAKEQLWVDTVLPLLKKIIHSLSVFLMKDNTERLCFNSDGIPALEARRERLFKRMVAAVGSGLVSIDEARVEMGFDEVGGNAADLLIPSGLKPLNSAAVDAVATLAKTYRGMGYSATEAQAKALADVG